MLTFTIGFIVGIATMYGIMKVANSEYYLQDKEEEDEI